MPAPSPDENRDGMRRALVPLPDELWPGMFALACMVRRSRVTWKQVKNQRMVGMTYRQWELRDPRLDDDHGDWVFGNCLNSPSEAETMVFIWNPPVTAEAQRLPVKTTFTTDGYSWPSVLSDLNVVLDTNYAGGGDTNTVPTQRRYFTRGGQFPTTIERRVYVSNTDWLKKDVQTDFPMPTEVLGDYNGKQLEIEPCLHPKLTMDSVTTTDVVVQDCVPERRGERIAARRSLGATNHTEWQRHIFDVRTQEQNGLFFRIVLIAHPPDAPALTVR